MLSKGTAINFISDDSRFARDIDVLIEKFISDAYNILKSIGLIILISLFQMIKYMNSQHQLPVMKIKTLVEVHHRVTKKSFLYVPYQPIC